jgi:hypothetical protein
VYGSGDVHGLKLAPSMLHLNVDPGSLELKLKLALVWFVGFAGEDVIIVSGGVVSTVQVCAAGVGSVLPAGSVALTSKVWLPSASPL